MFSRGFEPPDDATFEAGDVCAWSYGAPMAFRWTRIHALLGDEPAELSYDQITRAIAGHLAETDDLDWKAAWPDPSEFRKDIAAMANSGGGLIVGGVAETGDGRAEVEEPIVWSDPEERRLRAIANSGIHPPVFGLAFKAFESAVRAGFVVALSVPASEEAPHPSSSNGAGGAQSPAAEVIEVIRKSSLAALVVTVPEEVIVAASPAAVELLGSDGDGVRAAASKNSPPTNPRAPST